MLATAAPKGSYTNEMLAVQLALVTPSLRGRFALKMDTEAIPANRARILAEMLG
jgi:hypothetical protein